MSLLDKNEMQDPHQVMDSVTLTVDHLTNSGDGSEEPLLKRARLDDDADAMSIKQILFNINKAICLRLDAMENKLEGLSNRTRALEDKLDQVCTYVRQVPGMVLQQPSGRGGAVIVGLPQEKTSPVPANRTDNVQNLGANVTLITLNTEEDFPSGSWLGDESNPEMRVRVPITPSDLLHIHSNCRTPEKMALTMLDYLFDRDTQAASNLSGMGKHGKRQLDPLLIYGIRCHLIHRFSITEQDWHRIKQNIDSKCRTAYRRKMRGMPLTVKAFRGKSPGTYVNISGRNYSVDSDGNAFQHDLSDDSLNGDDSGLHIQDDIPSGGMITGAAAEIIQSSNGQIQVLHATPEQVAQLQQAHQIQILDGNQVMLQGPDCGDGIQVAVSMAQPDDIHVVSNDTGETIHINAGTS